MEIIAIVLFWIAEFKYLVLFITIVFFMRNKIMFFVLSFIAFLIPLLITYFSKNINIVDYFYSVTLSLTAAIIFYVFQIYIPNKRMREMLKTNLVRVYDVFKITNVERFLILIDRQDLNADEIINQKKFIELFKEKSSINWQTNWDRLIKEFEENKLFFKELLYDLEKLEQELLFVMNKLDINDENIFTLIKGIRENINGAKFYIADDNVYECYYKPFWRLMWSIFSWYDFISWYTEEDKFKKIINNI